MLHPVHYATSTNNVHIAYQVTGEGPIDVVRIPGSVSHLDLEWDCDWMVKQIRSISAYARLIRFDKRCTGLSDRPTDVATLEERVEDVRAVMDAAGSERAVLYGLSEGGPMACLFAATYPDRVRSLLLYGAMARFTRAPDHPWGGTIAQTEQFIARMESEGWPAPDFAHPTARKWFGGGGDDPAFLDWWVRLFRGGLSPAARAALARMNARIDVRDVLPAIRVPTTLLVREDDPDCPLDAARAFAARIPDARLVVLPGSGHLAYDIVDRLNEEVRRAVLAEAPEHVSERVLTTILFADVVRSTERLAEIGDDGWRGLIQRFYGMAREQLRIFQGAEVDTAGDGLLARFDGPARAIRCASAVLSKAAELGLAVRAGVHTGEVEVSDGAIRGIAVHTAARIAGLATGGEVLTSTTVRDLVAGSGLQFEDRGTHALKGVPEPRQILAVAS